TGVWLRPHTSVQGLRHRLVLRLAVDGKAQQDDGTHAWCRANAHVAAVKLDQRLGDGKAEPGALMALGKLAFHLLERATEIGERLLRDADAGILDGKHHRIAGGAAA